MVAKVEDRARPSNPATPYARPGAAEVAKLGDLLPQILARYGCTPKTNRPDIAREQRRVG